MDRIRSLAEAMLHPREVAPADPFALHRQRAVLAIVTLAAAVLLLVLNAPWHFVLGSGVYLPLHTAMEVFAVVVSAQVFGIGWHSFDDKTPPAIVVLSSAFLAVGLLDLGHLLSFPGMPAFITPSSVAKGIDFWLAARIAGALALLAAAVLPWKPAPSRHLRVAALGTAVGFTCLVYWLILFRFENLPDTFVHGRGLTTFKLVFEYALVVVYLLAAAILLRRARIMRTGKAIHLFSSACIMAMSELCFTLYANATDVFNVLGHVYKVLAYLYLYRAIFVEGVQEPFQRLEASRQSLKLSESKFRSLMEFAPDAILLIDREHRIVMMNARAEQLFGYSRDILAGMPAGIVMPGDSVSEQRFRAVVAGEHAASSCFETLCRRRDGTSFSVEINLGRLDAGELPLVIAIVRDITERRRSAEEKDRLIAILDATPDFVAFMDAQRRPLYLNRAGRNLLGLASEALPADLWGEEYMPDWAREIMLAEAVPVAERDGYWQGEAALRTRNGQEVPVSHVLLSHATVSGGAAYWSSICRDISERKHFETVLLDQLMHDALTGLPNRLLINEQLENAIARARNEQRMLAVLFLDIDHFKRVNDTFGHAFGDDVLREAVHRLKQVLHDGDSLARQGGDEFIILQQDISHADETVALAEQLLGCMRKPFHVAGREVFLSASVGISLFPVDEETEDGLLHAADIAMNSAKQTSRDCYCFHTPEMDHAIRERLELEGQLRHAVENGELLLHYQPRISMETGTQIGMEALVRWAHPEWGLIPPVRFIPLAEESGLIEQIDLWVLRAACTQVKAWQDQGLSPGRVSVNLSARQFQQAGLPHDVQAILRETGLAPASLELEITESTVMKDTESAIRTLRSLKQIGIGLSIDDFGTGYSSLSYLKLFPIDVLKIDRSFVTNVIDDPDDAAIARAIVALAHSLELIVVAEGVETPEQAVFLKACGCDEIQGFYFSRPIPADDMTGLLQGHSVMMMPEGARMPAVDAGRRDVQSREDRG